MKYVIGIITPKERDNLADLYEKKRAFQNLLLILDEDGNPTLYARLLSDIEEARKAYDMWWEKINRKYGWKENEVVINFATGEATTNH